MTMALVYKKNNQAFFLQDFRITYPKENNRQIDSMMKFQIFDNKIGLYFAGNIRVMKSIIEEIKIFQTKISINDIADGNGILVRKLNDYMRKNLNNYTYEQKVEILGFVIDVNRNKNECFYLELIPGVGVGLKSLDDDKVTIIGSGKYIPEIEQLLTEAFRKAIKLQKRNGYKLITIMDAVEQEIKRIFTHIGISNYSKLGISPYFAKAVLMDSSFVMYGQEINGDNITTDFNKNDDKPKSNKFKYKFYREKENVFLEDKNNNKKIIVKNAETFSEEDGDNIFDPEKLAERFDPSKNLCHNGVAYIINQWVNKGEFINRVIYRSEINDKEILNPNYKTIASDMIKIKNCNEYSNYILSGDSCLIVENNLQGIFEEQVNANLFNHKWMEKYVKNYSDIYYEGD